MEEFLLIAHQNGVLHIRKDMYTQIFMILIITGTIYGLPVMRYIFYSSDNGDSIYKKQNGIARTDFWGFGARV